MKGLFIPEITAEMLKNGCLESIETLMAEGEIYDIDYTGWIPVEWHTITDEEREREGYPEEWVALSDCVMPEDEQEILITIKGSKGRLWVEKDICYNDDTYCLDSGYDWIEDVVAWMPLPKPWKGECEMHCNCTDKEIAKSFIEDVEAVKDLLPRTESEK